MSTESDTNKDSTKETDPVTKITDSKNEMSKGENEDQPWETDDKKGSFFGAFIKIVLMLAIMAGILIGSIYYFDDENSGKKNGTVKSDMKKVATDPISVPKQSKNDKPKKEAEITKTSLNKDKEQDLSDIMSSDYTTAIFDTSSCKGGQLSLEGVENVKTMAVNGNIVSLMVEEVIDGERKRRIKVIDFCNNKLLSDINLDPYYEW